MLETGVFAIGGRIAIVSQLGKNNLVMNILPVWVEVETHWKEAQLHQPSKEIQTIHCHFPVSHWKL